MVPAHQREQFAKRLQHMMGLHPAGWMQWLPLIEEIWTAAQRDALRRGPVVLLDKRSA